MASNTETILTKGETIGLVIQSLRKRLESSELFEVLHEMQENHKSVAMVIENEEVIATYKNDKLFIGFKTNDMYEIFDLYIENKEGNTYKWEGKTKIDERELFKII